MPVRVWVICLASEQGTLDLGATDPLEVVAALTRYVLAVRLSAAAVTGLVLVTRGRSALLVLVVLGASVLSYAVLHRWRGVGALVLRHPLLLGLDTALSLVILAATGPESPWLLTTVSCSVLAGVFFRRRGAAVFSTLLVGGYLLGVVLPLLGRPPLTLHVLLVLPLLYPLSAYAGSSARDVLERAARGAVLTRREAEAMSAAQERLRLAREMHDSVAKSLHGIAMLADALPRLVDRHPDAVGAQAAMIALSARTAVDEGRRLLSNLRADAPDRPLHDAVRIFVDGSVLVAGIQATCQVALPTEVEVPHAVRYELFAVLGEALRNVVRHSGATSVLVRLEGTCQRLSLSVVDDGVGFEIPTDLREMSDCGHYGLAGMSERARSVRGHLTAGRGPNGGTCIVLDVPLADAGVGLGAALERHA